MTTRDNGYTVTIRRMRDDGLVHVEVLDAVDVDNVLARALAQDFADDGVVQSILPDRPAPELRALVTRSATNVFDCVLYTVEGGLFRIIQVASRSSLSRSIIAALAGANMASTIVSTESVGNGRVRVYFSNGVKS